MRESGRGGGGGNGSVPARFHLWFDPRQFFVLHLFNPLQTGPMQFAVDLIVVLVL